jgi:signal transduction histidine kinase
MGRELDLVRSETDLVALVRLIASEQQNTTEQHDVSVSVLFPDIKGEWDADRLERAITNLVSNAITYSPGGGHVQITVGLDGPNPAKAVVRVDDEGVGIPEQDLPFVFERFHRGSNVAGRIPGTGIGLAGAREIIQQHGGQITAYPRDGRGTTLEVVLPLKPPHSVGEAGSED